MTTTSSKPSRLVVTYAHAYVDGETTLCGPCEVDERVLEKLPSLGPVQHGAHVGSCDACGRHSRGAAAEGNAS